MPEVYDDEKTKADELSAMTGINPADEKAMEARAHEGASQDLAAAEESAAGASDTTKADQQEKSQVDDQVGTGFSKDSGDKEQSSDDKKGFWTRGKKAGAGVLGIVGVGGITALIFFLPLLKLNGFLSSIDERAWAAVKSVVERRLDRHFDRYMVSKITGLERCQAGRSIDCRVDYTRDYGSAGSLFKQWQDAKAEEKIFDRMGFQLESTRNPNPSEGRYMYNILDRRGRSVQTLGTGDQWERFKSGNYEGGRRQIGREIRKAMKDEFKWYQILQRRSVRKYFQRKHDVKFFCWFSCKDLDNLEMKLASPRVRTKQLFVERIQYPMQNKMGKIADCILSGNDCSSESIRNESNDIELTTQERNELTEVIDDAVENNLTGPTRPGQIISSTAGGAPEPEGARLSQRIMQRIVAKVIATITSQSASAASTTASQVVPILGQVWLAYVIVDAGSRIDSMIQNHDLSRYNGILKSSQYATYYAAMRSANDELKSHKMSYEEAGALMEEFDGAEESKVFNNYGYPESSAFFSSKAYAQGADDDEGYTCVDGDPIPSGQFVCNEKRLDKTFAFEDLYQNDTWQTIRTLLATYDECVIDTPGVGCTLTRGDVIGAPINAVNWASSTFVGSALNTVLSAASRFPGMNRLTDFMQEKFSEVMFWFMEMVMPLPLNSESLGREKYDGLEAGADVSVSEFSKGKEDGNDSYGLGAPKVTDEEFEAVMNDYYDQLQYEAQQKSLVAKLTDVENPYSIASRAVAAVPTKPTGMMNGIFNSFIASFSQISTTLLGIISNSAGAQSLAERQFAINAFGVSRYAYPLGHSAIDADPTAMDEEFCEQSAEAREESAYENELTGEEEYAVADPCLLDATVADVGARIFFDEEESSTGSQGGGSSLPSGNAQELARQIIASGRVTGDDRYIPQIRAIAEGNSSCHVNPTILGLILAASQRFDIYISSLNRRCTGVITASGTASYHYRDKGGHAVDISAVNGASSTGDTANDRQLLNFWLPLLPSGSGIGQSTCGARATNPLRLPNGVTEFYDDCSHIHIQVPVQ